MDLTRNQRWTITGFPSGSNEGVSLRLKSEDYDHKNDLIYEITKFIEENLVYLDERYGEDESES